MPVASDPGTHHGPVLLVVFIVVAAFVALLCGWLMWKMVKGSVEAGKSQERYYRSGTRRREDGDDTEQ